MPITINGSGTVTGITAGGLPDGVITTDDIAADAVTSAKIASGAIVDSDVNASAAIADSKLTGTTCKAWVNFNGTSTVSIRASYNVSSITDNAQGNYTVNFTSSISSNSAVLAVASTAPGGDITMCQMNSAGSTGSNFEVKRRSDGSTQDSEIICFAAFR